MKIYLKSDWDYPPSYKKDSSGYFIGREKEKAELVGEILRKNSGTVLVSGARGVGKTALVYASLKEASKDNEKLAAIVINASQLELYSHEANFDEKLPDIIIKNLIRRLYAFFEADSKKLSNELRERLADLYRTAVAKEVEKTKTYSNELSEENVESKSFSNKRELKISTDEKIRTIVSNLFIALGVAAFFGGRGWIVLGVIFMILSQISFVIDIDFVTSKAKELTRGSKVLKTAQSLYKDDNSLGNLEYELNNLLEDLWKDGFKIVFIIDELDKIEREAAEPVFSIIRTYKNLFTLSYALFIFITSEMVYLEVTKARDSRNSQYTLFANRVFINRPSFEDLEQFIETIIERVDELPDNPEGRVDWKTLKDFKNFKNLLCFNARSDYFDLYSATRDFITGYNRDGGKYLPFIDLPELDDFDELLKAKLQKALGQIYEHNHFGAQSEWYKNDALLKKLYSFIEGNYYRDFVFSSVYTDNADRMIGEDFIPYLERLEIIQEISRIPSVVTLPGLAVPVAGAENVSYHWTGNIPGQNDISDISSSPDILFKEEEEFLRVATDYVQQVNDIDDVLSLVTSENPTRKSYKVDSGIISGHDGQPFTGIGSATIFDKYEPRIKELEKAIPKHIPHQDLITYTSELKAELQKIKEVALQAFTNLLKKHLTDVTFGHASVLLASDPDLFQPIPDIRSQLVASNTPNSVIYSADPIKAKQLLITINIDPAILTEDNLRLLNQNRSYRIVNIQISDAFDYASKGEVEYQNIRYIKTNDEKGKTTKKRVVEKNVRKVPGFMNIKLEDDYTIFVSPIKQISEWFRS